MRLSAEPADGLTQPNILLILADDLGTDQLEIYDQANCGIHDFTAPTHEYPDTPAVDAIAAAGVRFKWAFTSPTCSPTRAQLMTGRYPFRTDIGGIVTPSGRFMQGGLNLLQQLDLRLEEETLPELAAAAGYSTALIGKWHLARDDSRDFGVASAFAVGAFPNGVPNVPGRAHPALTGWSYFAGIMHNPNNAPGPNNSVFPASLCDPPVAGCPSDDYYGWVRVESVPSPLPGRDDAIWSAEVISSIGNPDPTFITTVQRMDLQQWIENAQQPFLAVWAATAPHSPYNEAPAALFANPCQPAGSATTYDRYVGLIESLDSEIGELRSAMEMMLPNGEGQPSVWDNTVVVIMGDNGTPVNVMVDAELTSQCGGGGNRILPYQTNPTVQDPNAHDQRFKGSPYATGCSIPLVFSGCDVLGGTCNFATPATGRVEEVAVVETVDVFATLLEIMGAGMPAAGVDGTSLKPVLEGLPMPMGFEPSAMSLKFDPNGGFRCARRFAVGFTARVDDSTPGSPVISSSGTDLYRLVRTSEGVGTLCAPYEALFRVEASGVIDDIEEVSDQSSNQPDVLSLLSNALDALLMQGSNCSAFFMQCDGVACPDTCPSDTQL